jgi:hypothetical protein
MASERQIAANRRNAQKSTGPRSASGAKRSSRNAHRHGLTKRISSANFEKQLDMLTRQIAGDTDDEATLALARIAAEAQLDLMKIVRQAAETGQFASSRNLGSNGLKKATIPWEKIELRKLKSWRPVDLSILAQQGLGVQNFAKRTQFSPVISMPTADVESRVFASGIGFRIHNFLVIRRCNFLHQIVSGTAVRHFATCMTPC